MDITTDTQDHDDPNDFPDDIKISEYSKANMKEFITKYEETMARKKK